MALDALLIGRDYGLMWVLPQMLVRAGFSVDVITSSPHMRHSKFVRNCEEIPASQSLLSAAISKVRRGYDWVILAEDGALNEVAKSSLSIEEKLKLLPVQREENLSHLSSKIGLSKAFSSHGVKTPPFLIVHNLEEALSGASQLGYPVLLKQDCSGGGIGVFECKAPSDLSLLKPELFEEPLLLQKMIPGIELDLSAIYLNGDLVHFSYSKVEKTSWKFGPSSLRTYSPLHAVEKEIFQELSQIGKALGLHGFTNTGCIQSESGRFYFEVDVRPNVWAETPKFFGEDPALRIRKWFTQRESLSYPVPALSRQPSKILIPYFLRLRFSDLIFNRSKVWKFIPKEDLKLVARLIFVYQIKHSFILALKRIIPKKYHTRLGRVRRALFCFKT